MHCIGTATSWQPAAACCSGGHIACFFTVTFVYIHFNPHFDLEPDYIVRKPIVHRIQRCNLSSEILSTFHIWVDHRSARHFCTVKYTVKFSKNTGNHAKRSLFPLRHVDFHLTHECLSPPHSPSQTTARSLYAFPHNDTTKFPYNGTPQIHPPYCPFPFDDHHQNLIHRYQTRLHSPCQMASRSNQPCCHCSHVRTDRCDKRRFCSMSALLNYSDREWCANNSNSGPEKP